MGQDQGDHPVVGPPLSSNGDRTRALAEYGETLKKSQWTPDHQVTVDVTAESVEVQAAFEILKRKGVTSWAGFTISVPENRLIAARWMAGVHEEIEALFRSGWQPA